MYHVVEKVGKPSWKVWNEKTGRHSFTTHSRTHGFVSHVLRQGGATGGPLATSEANVGIVIVCKDLETVAKRFSG